MTDDDEAVQRLVQFEQVNLLATFMNGLALIMIGAGARTYEPT